MVEDFKRWFEILFHFLSFDFGRRKRTSYPNAAKQHASQLNKRWNQPNYQSHNYGLFTLIWVIVTRRWPFNEAFGQPRGGGSCSIAESIRSPWDSTCSASFHRKNRPEFFDEISSNIQNHSLDEPLSRVPSHRGGGGKKTSIFTFGKVKANKFHELCTGISGVFLEIGWFY